MHKTIDIDGCMSLDAIASYNYKQDKSFPIRLLARFYIRRIKRLI